MSLVQEASGSTTGSSLTITMPAAVGEYDGVIIAVCGYFGGVISDITIGGVGSTFSKVATSGGFNAEIWANLSVQPADVGDSIVITTTTDGIIAYVYEVPWSPPWFATSVFPDQSAGTYDASGSETSWSSGATGTIVSADEIVIGLGFVFPPAGTDTITGPAGWTTQPPVVTSGAGGYIGAVSGYQIPVSTGTYEYGGTVSAASDWAAVTATFLLMSYLGASDADWGGYVATTDDPAGFTAISATFTVPSASGESGALCSLWVGIGAVKQTGIYLGYDSSYSGNANCSAWAWYMPGSDLWSTAYYPVAAGDALVLSVSFDDNYWYTQISNVTAGWDYTEKKSVQAVNIGNTGPVGWPFPFTSCEVIVEREGGPLPAYGAVTFTGITATPAFANAHPVATINTSIDQVPGPLSAGSFTMNWFAYS